jgi:putative restriction endonuclease
VLSREEDLELRDTIFAWLRARQIHKPFFSRQDLASFEYLGRQLRLIGPQTGIWWLKGLSEAAVGIWSAYVPEGRERPYEDNIGADGFLRYKWRGDNPMTADNRALRLRHLSVVAFRFPN